MVRTIIREAAFVGTCLVVGTVLSGVGLLAYLLVDWRF
jgi:hypothetical protein